MDEMDPLTRLITADLAAQLAGVQPCTVRGWVSRGQLEVAEVDEQGRNLFRVVDVAKAERATRKLARRSPPTG